MPFGAFWCYRVIFAVSHLSSILHIWYDTKIFGVSTIFFSLMLERVVFISPGPLGLKWVSTCFNGDLNISFIDLILALSGSSWHLVRKDVALRWKPTGLQSVLPSELSLVERDEKPPNCLDSPPNDSNYWVQLIFFPNDFSLCGKYWQLAATEVAFRSKPW